MSKIAFIGLGNMGSGMCANLVKAGHQVCAFDLDKDAVQHAALQWAQAASDVEGAVADAEIIVTMLPAGTHVLEVYFGVNGVSKHAPGGTLFIDCSTIAVDDARAACKRASQQGYVMVDAPVSGGVAAANNGALTFMVGGSSAAYARAEPILEAMGGLIVHAGRDGNGQAAKIANNMLLGISMIATCEAFDLAKRLGLDAQTFFDISSKASGQNWSMTSYCPAPGPVPAAPSNNAYKPGFTVEMMLKDLRLASDASASAGAKTELGSLAMQVYAAMSTQGHGALDFSGVMKAIDGTLA